MIIGKRSVDDPGTPHENVINCTTTVARQTTNTKTTVAIETAPAKASDSYTDNLSTDAGLSSSARTLDTTNHVTSEWLVQEKTPNVTSTGEHLPTDNQSSTSGLITSTNSSRTTTGLISSTNSSRTTTPTDTSRTTTVLYAPQSTVFTEGGKHSSPNISPTSLTTPQTPEANTSIPITQKKTPFQSSQSATPSVPPAASNAITTPAATPRSTTFVVDGASKDTSDSFDHDLAIIFGSMLGLMLLSLFCFGVFRCYRREKSEFNKSQNNLSSINL
ncbi:mucin-2-like isoform X2 [Ostrea edulis]|nr:mucin-2-like isoform X2 [Ostrea edulis]